VGEKQKKAPEVKIVVDTNLVFSAVLNTNSKIGDLLLNSADFFEFYSCQYLWYEINKHRQKLKILSKLTEKVLRETEYLIYNEICFIAEEQIPKEHLLTAIELVKDIDNKDILFIALTEFLDSKLWTGDKKLLQGLKLKGYNNVISTEEMILLRSQIEKEGAV
jgi:predicted nucleic acid-binding protein